MKMLKRLYCERDVFLKNKKIRILVHGMQNVRGGIEMYLYNFAKYCEYKEFSLDFLNMQPDEIIYQDELKKLGCDIVKVTPSDKNFKACTNELKKLLNEQKYDYIYINLSSYTRFHFIVQMVKPKKTKIIIHCHGMPEMKMAPLKSRISHSIGKIFFNNIDVLRVTCGNEAGKFMFSNKEFEVFPNGIEIDKFKFDENHRNEIRNEFNIKNDELVFGLIARLAPEKNQLFLLDIFSEILKKESNSKLILVGDGSGRNMVEERIKELGIIDDVILTGARNDAYKFYSALDAFVMPSISEGFGISIAEAQANGLFCFGSDNLDKSTNLTGNVKYISLNLSAREWAEIILKNMKRDSNALEKFSENFKAEESYKRIFKFLEENLK